MARLLTILVLLVVIVGTTALVIVPTLQRAIDPAARLAYEAELARAAARAEALEPWWIALQRLAVAVLASILMAIGAACGALAYAAWQYLPARARAAAAVYHMQHGLPPVLVQPERSNLRVVMPERNPTAEALRAMFAGAETPGTAPVRLPTAAATRLLATPEPGPEPPEALADSTPPYLPLDEVVRVEPTNPHWLLIGATGCGKSVASYTILERIRRALPAEFIVLERDGVDWNAQAAATDLRGYMDVLRAVEAERRRRVALLRAADVEQIGQLAAPPPYLVVVIEEAETIYSDLARMARAVATEYIITLRALAALGRKTGIMLMAITQTGTSAVFDVPTRKNFGHRLLFRSEPGVGDAWGIPRTAGLESLPTGTAYDLAHRALVRFPQAARPALPRAEAVLATVHRQETSPVPEVTGIPVVDRYVVPQDRPPTDEATRRLIYERWRVLGSLKAVERELYGQEGGIKFYWVREAVRSLAPADVDIDEEPDADTVRHYYGTESR